MALENVRKFEELINGDEALQARLRELTECFDGDSRDPRAVFEAVVSPLAAEAGLPYTYDEAFEYVEQKDDDEDLTADEVKAVAGGYTACGIIGFGDVDANACAGEYVGAGACAGIGIGIMATV